MNEHELNYLDARRKFLNGEECSFSTGFFDNELTAGYGELNEFGYFEFPLPVPQQFKHSMEGFSIAAFRQAVEREYERQAKEARDEVSLTINNDEKGVVHE